MNKQITSFSGEYRFLSNFWPCEVEFEGLTFSSTEGAYQAAKTLDPEIRLKMSKATSPGAAKRFGQQIHLRADWEEVKISVMRNLLEQKFKPGTELHQKLLETRPHDLIEGNTWGDTFWGECPVGNGKNNLGKLLMAIRDDITQRIFE